LERADDFEELDFWTARLEFTLELTFELESLFDCSSAITSLGFVLNIVFLLLAESMAPVDDAVRVAGKLTD